jgi:hypothetical protein
MYARVQRANVPVDLDVAMRQTVVDTISGHPGFAGLYLLDQMGVGRRIIVTLWQTRDEAVGASGRTRAKLGPRPFELELDEIYEVVDDWSGTAGAESPGAAAFMQFETPMSQARYDAGQRGAKERIQPALAGHPGAVRALALWDDEARRFVVFTFATSIDALDECGRIANSTDLLPGEDPALLAGPTRADLCRVVAVVPAPVAVL